MLEPTGIASLDTAAIQAAEDDPDVLDIELGIGTWAIGKRALRAGVRISDRPTPLVIRGQHEHGTVLKLVDMDGGLGGDCHMLAFDRCNHLSILNLTLDGNRVAFPDFDQQAHGLYLNGCHYLTIQSVHTRNMIMDGAYFIGQADSESDPLVEDVNILSTSHANNGRSGLAFQRGARNVLIDGLVARGLSDAAIDTEATGTPAENFTIRNVQIYPVTEAYALSVGGYGGLPCKNFHLENIEIINGATSIYHAHQITLQNVRITGRAEQPPLLVRGNVDGLRLVGGVYIGRHLTGDDGTISLGQYNGSLPQTIKLYEVQVVTACSRSGLTAEDTNHLELHDCHLVGAGDGNGLSYRNVSRTAGIVGVATYGGTISHFNNGVYVRPYSDRAIHNLTSLGMTGSNLYRGIYVEGSAYLESHLVASQWMAVDIPEAYE